MTAFIKVVVCPGPWAPKLFPELKPHLKTPVIPVTYWRDQTVEKDFSVAKGFPVIFNARLTDVYGVPSYEYPGRAGIDKSEFNLGTCAINYALRPCQDCVPHRSRGMVTS